MPVAEFVPLSDKEAKKIGKALDANIGGSALLMDAQDTSFAGSTDVIDDEEVINAIKSVPCHY